MPIVSILARSGGAPIKKAWFYLKQGGTTTTLWSDAEGQLLASAEAASGDPPQAPKIATFVKRFTIEAPCTVDLAYSRGGLVVPEELLKAIPSAFTKVNLAWDPEKNPHPIAVVVAPNDLNTVQALPALTIDLPAVPLTFEEPAALQVWPMLASPFPSAYATSALPQGTALWPEHGSGPVQDGAAARAADKADCPHDLGVRIRGQVSNHAPKVDLYLLDAKGARLKFRLTADAKPDQAVDILTLDVKAESSRFDTTLFSDDPARFFGLVQVVAVTKGGGLDGLGDVVAALLGVQLGLCDDGVNSEDGDVPGPCVNSADEKNVIDFLVTAVRGPLPGHDEGAKRAAKAALSPHSRARRMVCFDIRATRKRRSSRASVDAEAVLLPEMPMWMAELQLVGWRRDEGELLLQLRGEILGATQRPLVISADFALELAWRGPDADLPGPPQRHGHPRNPYSNVSRTFTGSFREPKRESQVDPDAEDDDPSPPVDTDEDNDDPNPPTDAPKVVVHFDAGRVLSTRVDIAKHDGTLRIEDDGSNSLQPEFPWAAAPFPTEQRRAPKVWLAERSRAWGWKAGGALVPALVFEWQPPIVDVEPGNRPTEIMLGGNGLLKVETLSIAGQAISRDRQAANAPTQGPLLALPPFRVKGQNPSPSAVEEILTAAIRDVIAANPDARSPNMLSVPAWKRLSEILMFHESHGEHFSPAVGRVPYAEHEPCQCHGMQSGMPKFGAPAGYGLGQHDPPRSLQDMWSFYEHIYLGVTILMVKEFGGPAFHYLNELHRLDPDNLLHRAIFLRETVRRYNGGREMVYENGHWRLAPHTVVKGKKVPLPEKRVPYVDKALGTNTIYADPARAELPTTGTPALKAALSGKMSPWL